MTRTQKLLICILPLFLMLQGCASMLQRSGISTYYSDSNIKFAIVTRYKRVPGLYKYNHIVPTVYEGTVLLAGQVMQANQRIEAEKIIKGIPGIKRIYNELEVSGPTSTLTRSSDSWITSRVKADMVFTKGLESRNVKIVTENGVVYLMGTVTPKQSKLASTVARKVPGVQKVVTLFVIK